MRLLRNLWNFGSVTFDCKIENFFDYKLKLYKSIRYEINVFSTVFFSVENTLKTQSLIINYEVEVGYFKLSVLNAIDNKIGFELIVLKNKLYSFSMSPVLTYSNIYIEKIIKLISNDISKKRHDIRKSFSESIYKLEI